MALESAVQHWLHTFEQGALAKWVRRVVVTTALTALSLFWLLAKFNGFSVPDAMDQAQIGRQIASGQGYTTLYARPLALRTLLDRGKLRDPLPELNNAPLGPLLDALIFRSTGMHFRVSESSSIATGELLIAATGVVFLLGALLTSFLLGRALFDDNLALLGTGLLACTALLWRFSTSGLPQMAMLVLFNASLLLLIRALKASDRGQRDRTLRCAWFAAFLLGLVTLGNGVGLWLFPGFLLFASVALRPRRPVMAGCVAAYFLPLLPWAWHNWKSIGQPFGLPWFEWQRPAGVDPLAYAADFEPDRGFHWLDFLANTATQAMTQITDLFSLLGHNIVAVAFYLAVIFHTFRKWEAAQLRWPVLLMWAGAFVGMSLAGADGPVSVNQLHVLFLPAMVFYGLAFLLVLWGRMGFEQPLLRAAFIVLLYVTVSAPLLVALGARSLRFNWPPYLPILVEKFADWTSPAEAIGSDIPWATAWYAGRRSLLLPESVEQFQLIDSERLLGAPLVAIYLTPASGDSRAYADIVSGRYHDWARLIFKEAGNQTTQEWALGHRVVLPINGGSLFFTDRPRWKE